MSDQQLKSIVERIQRLTEERKTIASDIAEVYAEAKANGYDKAAIKWVVSEMEKPEIEREERDHIRELYWQAATGPSHVHVHETPSGAEAGSVVRADAPILEGV
jgi:uncharacterized protein (UPF0335 family)